MAPYLVQQFVDYSKTQCPEDIALSSPASQISYEHLWSSSNKLVNLLLSNNLRRQDRIVIFLDRSVKSVISMIGALKADAIYISIDRKIPLERLKLVVRDCQPSAIICDRSTIKETLALLENYQPLPLVVVLEEPEDIKETSSPTLLFQSDVDAQPNHQPEYKNIDIDLAHIIYTSGSTGAPKGVMISHLNIINYIEWATEIFQVTHEDVILGTAPFHFDMSTFDIFCALKAGSTLCIAPEGYLLFPQKILDLINAEGVTIWKAVSSLLMYIAKTRCLENHDLPSLKKILFAGEVLPTKYLIQWMQQFPDKEFYNAYGPSEATGVSTYFKVGKIPEDPQARIPIGKACPNTEVFILDDSDTIAPVGEIGEVCIRGSGIAHGYWKNPEKTFSAFTPNPINRLIDDLIYRTGDLARQREDGNFEFVGQKDQQLKWMGYRLELGEIENALLAIEGIKDCAVVMVGDDHQKELVAYVEPEADLNTTDIMAKLELLIPRYMLPKQLIMLEGIPRTERGKVNRRVLTQEHIELTNYPLTS